MCLRFIYQILLGWKPYKYYYETDQLPNPRPTQPKEKWVKSGILGHFCPQEIFFFVGWDWFYIGNRLQETEPNQILGKHYIKNHIKSGIRFGVFLATRLARIIDYHGMNSPNDWTCLVHFVVDAMRSHGVRRRAHGLLAHLALKHNKTKNTHRERVNIANDTAKRVVVRTHLWCKATATRGISAPNQTSSRATKNGGAAAGAATASAATASHAADATTTTATAAAATAAAAASAEKRYKTTQQVTNTVLPRTKTCYYDIPAWYCYFLHLTLFSAAPLFGIRKRKHAVNTSEAGLFSARQGPFRP